MMKQHNQPLVIVISGPTGIGKTALSIKLAQHFQTEIISADSRQCYREMTIGTAKPNEQELATVKHHFINSHSIENPANAFDFEQYALERLDDIFKKHPTAIVCGGTGLYIKSLCEGLDDMPAINKGIENAVYQEYLEKGKDWLREKVANEDPEFFQDAEVHNPARLLRALTFIRSTNQSISHFKTNSVKKRNFKILKIALDIPRETLYRRINQRVALMMANGLLKEAESLYPFGHLKALNTVGYTELFDFFSGQHSLEIAVNLIQQHSRNYAKRQLTWFRKDNDFQWFEPNDIAGILAYIKQNAAV